jgi:archaeosine synthase beta-subunit
MISLQDDRGGRTALDSSRPYAFFVEQEKDLSGQIISVATIFLINRECPWRCIYCDLWKNTTVETVPPGAVSGQIGFALAQPGMSDACQIKLYNAGSFFDPKAIPPDGFPAIAERLRDFERVIVECHPALVGASAVRFRDLLNRTSRGTLEVAMGLEIADDAILAKLNKRMTLAMFARLHNGEAALCAHPGRGPDIFKPFRGLRFRLRRDGGVINSRALWSQRTGQTGLERRLRPT